VYGSESVPPPLSPADPTNTAYSGWPGNNYVDEDHFGTTVVVVQIANPYDRAIPVEELQKYQIRVFGKDLDLGQIPGIEALQPATEDNPATAIFAMVEQTFDHPTLGSVNDFRTEWQDFMDLIRNEDGVLRHPNDSQIYFFDPSAMPAIGDPWEGSDRAHYESWTPGADENAIELRRRDYGDPGDNTDDVWVVVDRFDYDDAETDHDQFLDQVQRLAPPPPRRITTSVPGPLLNGIRIGSDDFFIQWARVARAWGFDRDALAGPVPVPDGVQFDERAPRYVIANQGVTPDGVQDLGSYDGDLNPGGTAGPYRGAVYADGDDPDMPWFSYPYKSQERGPTGPVEVRHKPTFFDHQALEFNNGDPYIAFPDKGFYGENIPFPGSMQMLQKDYDFQQVGELLNVWLLGHELSFVQTGPDPLNPRDYDYDATTVTFSEFMHKSVRDLPQLERHRANRLNTTEGEVLGLGSAANPRDGQHAVPDLPAALRVLDMFVCDGPGVNYNPTTDAYGDLAFGNAALFEGRPTYGLININTAPIEVMRTLPHWYKTVHNDPAFVPEDRFPKVAIAESAVSYRERIANPIFPPVAPTIGFAGGPDYSDRPMFQGEQVREERGFASIGELRLLTQTGSADIPFPFSPPVPQAWSELFQDAWSIEFAANDPFDRIVVTTPAAHMSTDVVPVRDPGNPLNFATPPVLDSTLGDAVSGDAEEENLLFAGASNLVTTRSDFFTVYFRVRSFRENESGVWDATDPEYIVDDTRYVMLIDRSQVNRPSDKPRIVYFEKLP
jgi:hypothetical protein